MSINERVREVRRTLGLTQKDFGKKLAIAQSYLTNIETGRREVTEKIQKLICLQFDVNEDWLRTGQGEMFTESDATILHDLQEQYNLDDFGMRFMEAFLKLSPEQRAVIQDFASAIVETREKNTADPEQTIEQLEAEYKKMLSGLAPSKESSVSNITVGGSSTAKVSEG